MESKLKTFNVRIPQELWTFLKYDSFDKGVSMNSIVTECLNKYKRKMDNKLISK